jgi:predicted acyltransferase
LIVLMAAGDFAAGVAAVPSWLKHAPDVGLTVADLVAPGFVFAIGLTLVPSYARRAAQKRWAATEHLITRALALIGIGAILSAGSTVVAGAPAAWGVLQALGAATLLCLPVVTLGPVPRALVGVALLAAYQVLLTIGFIDVAPAGDHGGFAGSMAWGAMLIIATVLADGWRAGRARYLALCGGLALLATASVALTPISKLRVTASYVLIAVLIVAVVVLLADLASRRAPDRAGPLAWWGENPLVLYLAHLILVGAMQLLGPVGYANAPLGLAAAELLVVLAIMTVLAQRLHAHGLRVRL